jgi:hypothetical protein
MKEILLAVMAIGLAVLFTYGGLSYFNPDAATRSMTARGLSAQYDAIRAAAATYKAVNNGVTPTEKSQIDGFLPGGDIPVFGNGSEYFAWDIGGQPGHPLCMKYTGTTTALNEAAFMLAAEAARAPGAKVSYGAACGEGTVFSGGTIKADFAGIHPLVVTFGGF